VYRNVSNRIEISEVVLIAWNSRIGRLLRISKLVASSPKRCCLWDGHFFVSYGIPFLGAKVGSHGSSGKQQSFKNYLQLQRESEDLYDNLFHVSNTILKNSYPF